MRLPLAWLAIWVLGLIVVSALQPPDVEALVNKLFLAGWVVLWVLILGIWLAQIRRGVSRDAVDLYERLALTPPTPRAKASIDSSARVSLAYLGFAFIVVALATIAFATGGSGAVLLAMVGFVAVVGVPLMVVALRSVRADMEALMTALGLEVTETPAFWLTRGLASGRVRMTMDGAQVFAGQRHGRVVSVAQRPNLAITLVEPLGGEPWLHAPPEPSSAEEMAALTGASAASFANVTVTTSPQHVEVERQGGAVTSQSLLDIALAEAIADVTAEV